MVLIVDDNKKYIDRLIALLAEAGNKRKIIVAHDYTEAVRVIAKERPVIVLLDVNMPGKSGIEVLRYIKREGWYCKIIMVTNHSNESYRKLCLEAGADHFLDKSRDFGLIPSLLEEITS
jgi:two-component system chemotaxis response regulator CheY